MFIWYSALRETTRWESRGSGGGQITGFGSLENFIFEEMELSEKKLRLIERLMRVRNQVVLEQLEELLVRAEMELRAEESLKAIENNDVVALDGFTQNNQSWIKKRASK